MRARWIALLGVWVLLAVLATEVQAGVTSLMLHGEPGDYIVGDQTLTFTEAQGTFTAQRNYDNGISVSFHTPNYEHWWYLDFAAPNNVPLTVGVYEKAQRFPFQDSGHPGLDLSGDGRG